MLTYREWQAREARQRRVFAVAGVVMGLIGFGLGMLFLWAAL